MIFTPGNNSFTPSSTPFLRKTKICFNPSLPSKPTAVIFFSATFGSGIRLRSDSTSMSRLILLIFGMGWLRRFAHLDTCSSNCFGSGRLVSLCLSNNIFFSDNLVSSEISKSYGITALFSIL